MKLIHLTVVIDDWRNTDSSDENINDMLGQVRHGFGKVVDLVGERFNVAIKIDEE